MNTPSQSSRPSSSANQQQPNAAADLLPLVYAELRKLAAAKLANESPGHTLDATALVHEAYLKLLGNQLFDNRGHFFAAAAEAMRQILVDQARKRKSMKRGGAAHREAIDPNSLPTSDADEQLISLDEALDLFAVKHPEHAELVKLRYFAGLSADDAATLLGISPSTADRRWNFARAWLRRALHGEKTLI
jgi:RNA polymerase sigma factor (TIGR02999 family)